MAERGRDDLLLTLGGWRRARRRKAHDLCCDIFMGRSKDIAKLMRLKPSLKRFGVEHFYLFGSTTRGEAREDSDIDPFFDHPEGSLGLFALMEVKEAAVLLE